jgi:hypothetical protein
MNHQRLRPSPTLVDVLISPWSELTKRLCYAGGVWHSRRAHRNVSRAWGWSRSSPHKTDVGNCVSDGLRAAVLARPEWGRAAVVAIEAAHAQVLWSRFNPMR